MFLSPTFDLFFNSLGESQQVARVIFVDLVAGCFPNEFFVNPDKFQGRDPIMTLEQTLRIIYDIKQTIPQAFGGYVCGLRCFT